MEHSASTSRALEVRAAQPATRPRPDVIAAVVMALLLGSAGVAPAQIVDTTLWVANAPVRAVVSDGSTVYIGGDFTTVGPATGHAVVIDPTTAIAQQPYLRVNGFVSEVVPDGSGGWYLCGAFTAVRGQPRSNLAHLDASGNLTAWNPNASDRVTALVVSNGTVYVGGFFTSVGGQPRQTLAAIDGATGAVTAWNPGTDGYVLELAVGGGSVYVGGRFTYVDGQRRPGIAAFDEPTGTLEAWDPGAQGCHALAVSGGTVYAGGGFGLVAFNASTGATLFNANANRAVYAIALDGNVLYVGGEFTSIGGQPRNRIAALNAVTGAAGFWNPDASGATRPGSAGGVYALALGPGVVYAGGEFTVIGGQPRSNLAALYAATGGATAWNPAANEYVFSLAVNGGTVLAGGDFTSVGAQPRNHLAALDAATGSLTPWNPNANDLVYALALVGNTVYAGGRFTNIGLLQRSHIAALDAASGKAKIAWNPGADSDVFALVPNGTTVVAGGHFTSIAGQARNRIAALDAASGFPTAWDPNANNDVFALVLFEGTVLAGGSFTNIGGQARNRIAALDPASGAATAWDPNANESVRALAVSGRTVYAGGRFTGVGGQPRYCIAALDAGTAEVSAWNPIIWHSDSDPVHGIYPVVYALAVSGGAVYAGGYIDHVGSAFRNGFAAIDVASGQATAWDPEADNSVYALAVSGETMYVGGRFTGMGGQPQSNIAAISLPDLPTPTLLSLFEAGSTADGIELRWGFGDASRVMEVAVERAPNRSGPWTPIVPELRDESGVTVAMDRTAEPGTLYYYQLDVRFTGGDRMSFGPVSAILGEGVLQSDPMLLSPNPTSGGAEVRYTVSRAGRVRLEVLDVTGRVEAVLEDRFREPGRHTVAWDGAERRLSPGVHFVRLVGPDGVMSRKLAIVQ